MSYYNEIAEIAAIGDVPTWREYRLTLGGNRKNADGNIVDIPSARVEAFINGEVARCFDAFSVIEQTGYWKGVHERSWVIVILSDDPTTAETLRSIAERYNRRENQECCLLSIHPITSVAFISTRARA